MRPMILVKRKPIYKLYINNHAPMFSIPKYLGYSDYSFLYDYNNDIYTWLDKPQYFAGLRLTVDECLDTFCWQLIEKYITGNNTQGLSIDDESVDNEIVAMVDYIKQNHIGETMLDVDFTFGERYQYHDVFMTIEAFDTYLGVYVNYRVEGATVKVFPDLYLEKDMKKLKKLIKRNIPIVYAKYKEITKG